MELSAKPDFERAKTMWEHFYAGEVYKRPLVLAQVHVGPGAPPDSNKRPLWLHCTGNIQAVLDQIDQRLASTAYLGEAIPAFAPNLGPDQFASFLGAELKFAESSKETNWVDPIVEDWEDFLPIEFDPNAESFQKMLSITRQYAQHAEGRYLVAHIDKHSHADTLSALRGPQQFMMDLIEQPDVIERAMQDVRRMYVPIFEMVYDAGRMGGEKGSAQLIWSPGKAAILQCDMIIMISPALFRKFIIPAIEEEAAYVDHSIFHTDGVGAFRHLDDLLAIKDLDIIQLTPGAAAAPNHTFVDLFKKILAAGKSVQVMGKGLTPDRVKVLHKELGPRGVMYCPQCASVQEAEELMTWLEQHT